jgi:hypothetical protein
MPRNSCLYCYLKHVSQAIVLLIEARTGYPEHRYLAIGHLAEAEAESIKLFPELALRTRDQRLQIMDNPRYDVDLMGLLAEADRLLNTQQAAPSKERLVAAAASEGRSRTNRRAKGKGKGTS